MHKEDSYKKWAENFKQSPGDGTDLLWPSETLIRLFKGDYLQGNDKKYKGRKILDIGFGNGNNLIFFGSLGLDLYGTEVDKSICAGTKQRLEQAGLDADLQVGYNRSLPFESNMFDYLVSWNVLHYEDNEKDIKSALKEYNRVLKPGGRLVLSTTGPDHKILTGARTVGAHLYEIGRDDDFRKGEVFFYFDAPNYIRYYFSEFFDDLHIGRTHDNLFTEVLDWYIVTGIKS